MDITAIAATYWPAALIVLGAVVAVLKFVAPRTKTLKDDKAAEVLEDILDFADGPDREDEK